MAALEVSSALASEGYSIDSTFCVENYSDSAIPWYVTSVYSDAQLSSTVTTDVGSTTCENMATFVNGGAQENMDYMMWVQLGGEWLNASPFMQFQSTGGDLTFVCGMNYLNY